MHEMSLAESVLQIVVDAAARQGLGRVTRVRLEIGSLAGVEQDALRFAFESMVAGSVADSARLEITDVPARGRCPACKEIVAVAERFDACPSCGTYGMEIVDGTQMRVMEIEAMSEALSEALSEAPSAAPGQSENRGM